MTRVFIDGSAGTTGLRIRERLADRKDIELMILSEERRKNADARKESIAKADLAFLCLPDDAAREAVALAEDADTVIIDTSTAHRTNDAWAYGFPEIGGLREKIKNSKRIANPGCYASGFIALVAPLVENGLIDQETYLSCFGISGYSGGGKKMITQYEADEKDPLLDSPRMYALTQAHKHIPEMVKFGGLKVAPVFTPVVASYFSGMIINVPLFEKDCRGGRKSVEETYKEYYNNGLVHYAADADENGFFASNALSGTDIMQVSVFGNDERMLLSARFDNLGKGASGAAIQNMNIAIGIEESFGLVV